MIVCVKYKETFHPSASTLWLHLKNQCGPTSQKRLSSPARVTFLIFKNKARETHIEILQVLQGVNEAQFAQRQENRDLGIRTGFCGHVVETLG